MKDYSPYLQKAMRNVVKDVLADVAQNGLTDESYYVLSFKTPHTTLPDFVRAKYPEEMTIILQHQFQDLSVDDKGITVTLGFGGVPCTIQIPYTCLISFVDPSKQFGLSLTPSEPEFKEVSEPSNSAKVIDLASRRKK